MKARFPLLRSTQVFVVLAALALAVAPAFAVDVGDDGVFQIDGNVLLGDGAGDDWETLFNCPAGGGLNCTSSGSGGASARSYVEDPAPLSIYTGGGSKDNNPLSQWQFKDGNVPDKDNLLEAFAAVYASQRLYFGASRFANNGDAQIGFWFFQNVVKLGSNGTFVDGNGNPAKHKDGDLLILSDFTQGGSQSNIQVLRLNVASNGSESFTTLAAGSAGTTRVCNSAGTACAATNAGETDSLDPDYKDKFATPAGTYPPVVFFEGGVDLAALGLAGECFPNFLVETRSSQSIDAVLKDFTLKEFQQCSATITTEVHNAAHENITGMTVAANTPIHDKAIVTGTAGFDTPTGTVTFEFFTNATCAGTPSSTEAEVPITEVTPETPTTPGVAEAESTPFTPSPGSFCFRAKYNGDANYPATDFSSIEPVTVSRFDSAVNTRVLRVSDGGEVTNQAINLNNAVSVAVQDEATVTGAGPTPTGNVTIIRFDNGNCSGTAASSEDVVLDGTGKALSSVFNLGPDTLSYRATYNGDSNYEPSTVSKCEPVCALNFTTSQP